MVSEIFEPPKEKMMHPDNNHAAVQAMFDRVKADSSNQRRLYDDSHYKGMGATSDLKERKVNVKKRVRFEEDIVEVPTDTYHPTELESILDGRLARP